ncbi:COR domain-containing protein [Streptomyces sp. NPDC048710]|uniref:COR domain-containing protein n=1 Tax=Streptomyces sp. NPDC048710 TaxID=3365586 RepID=UPI0037221435
MTDEVEQGSAEAERRIAACIRDDVSLLDLSRLGIRTIPESLTEAANLEAINLAGNKIHSIPDFFTQLTRLQGIDLSGNSLTSLPDSISNLNRLTTLELENNQLTDIPSSIRSNSKLRTLLLHGNSFTALPDSIYSLPHLVRLGLDADHLENLVAHRPRRLDTLLVGSKASDIPEVIGEIQGIRSLSLLTVNATSLPDSIGRLSSLDRLSLHCSTGLTHLPDSIGDLTRLRSLDIFARGLTSLPHSIGNLVNLKYLHVFSAQLTHLPDSFGNLENLTELFLDRSRLTTPPPEILSAGAKAVVEFFREMSHDSVEQWASKVLVVGQGRAGKTSLLRRLRGESHDPQEDSTHGLNVSRLTLPHPSQPAGAETALMMDLSTWDFGGQDIYHATHQFFLTDRSLFLLLWDAQVGWEESKLYYWLDLIKARAPYAPVILVATHLGPRPPDLPLSAIDSAYPGMVVASLAVDNADATEEQIAEVRKLIAEEAAKLPLMGASWPRRWLNAAEAVRSRPEKHVSPDEMRGFMAQEGVTQPSQQQALSTALHSLGDILYYPDDEELGELVILHPQWLTAYISRVLDDEQVRAEGGVFTPARRRDLWCDLNPSMRQHFIGMMERFDLSYRTTDGNSSLVVELLPWDPPSFQDQWDMALTSHHRQLRLRYRLHTVPPGIPTWFIAREHRFTTGLHWRLGALLRHEDGHMGLVTVDRHAKVAEIQVRGPYPYDFFAVLKDGFEQTLLRYPGLEITRFVPCPGAGPLAPCSHEFPHHQLVDRLTRTPPRETIECPVHYEDLDVRKLLHGIEAPLKDRSEALASAALSAVAELSNAVQGQGRDILEQFAEAKVQRAAIAAEQQRTFLARQHQDAAFCPSVISIAKVKRRRALGVLPGHVFQLHLYCEAPGAWHRLPNVAPYEVRSTPESVAVVLPYAQRLLSVLKYAVPVVGAGLGMASEDLDKLLKDDIELMKALLEGLPEELIQSSDEQLNGLESFVRAQYHSEYREMYALLKKLDPNEKWGGLNKTTTPEGHTYWLCKVHADSIRALPPATEATTQLATPRDLPGLPDLMP